MIARRRTGNGVIRAVAWVTVENMFFQPVAVLAAVGLSLLRRRRICLWYDVRIA